MSKNTTKIESWHAGSTGNHQGLIISEAGENIAVCYDKKHAPLIAAAPELLAVVKKLQNYSLQVFDINCTPAEKQLWQDANAAISKAEAL